MKKLCNFRIETTLLNELDKLGGNKTQHVTNALQKYLQMHDTDTYSVNMSTMLLQQTKDLKQENKELKHENEFYHMQSLPFWKRRSYKKMLKQLPRGMQ